MDRKAFNAEVRQSVEDDATYNVSDYGMPYLKEFEAWKPKSSDEGIAHMFDIIPFQAGENWPTTDPKVKPGKAAFVLHAHVHMNIGPNGDNILCPKKNYEKRCPICEYIKIQNKRGVDWDELKDLSPKHRNIYNVMPYSTDDVDNEEDKGVRILEVSSFFMSEKLAAEAKQPRQGGVLPYASIDKDGRTIYFIAKKKKRGYEYIAHKLLSREDEHGKPYEIGEDLLEQAIDPSGLLILLSFEKIEAVFKEHLDMEIDVGDDDEPFQEEPGKEETLERPARRSSRRGGGEETKEGDPEPEKKEDTECIGGGILGVDFNKLEPCAEKCAQDIYEKCEELHDQGEEKKPRRRRNN